MPAGDETASLLVELNRIADDSDVEFQSITARHRRRPASTGEAHADGRPAAEAVARGGRPPTEAAAALLPLGATIGPAGLGVMPYDLAFNGSFFHVADFIQGIDSLVHTDDSKVAVDGRLVTLDGFALTDSARSGFPDLDANFSVTTYLVPPGQGVTAGASPTAPAEPAKRSTEVAPEEATTEGHPPRAPRKKPDELAQKGPEIKLPKKMPERQGARLPLRPLPRPARPPPAAAGRVLLVAIVAVPIALSESAGTSKRRRSRPAPTASRQRQRAQVVVAKSTPGLRDYRKRLDDLSRRTPSSSSSPKPARRSKPKAAPAKERPSSEVIGGAIGQRDPRRRTANQAAPTETSPNDPNITFYSFAIDVRVVAGLEPTASRARPSRTSAATCRS